MTRKKATSEAVTWLSNRLPDEQHTNFFHYYEKFKFKNIIAGIGDFVLISNADTAEPDTEEGCDVAKIITLYEDPSNNKDPFRAKVQWYSKSSDFPVWAIAKMKDIIFLDKEVLEDHRPFDTDVSIETFFKKCSVTFTFTKDYHNLNNKPYSYICRYRLMALTKRKIQIEPVLEEERKALELLATPVKSISSPRTRTPKTPSTLIKKINRISISEKNWSVTKNNGTKIMLKRAILSDKNENNSLQVNPPQKNATNKITVQETPTSSKKLNKNNLEEFLEMELQENSDEEIPTLIIRQPNIIKSKTVTNSSCNEAKLMLVFTNDNDNDVHTTRSGRKIKKPVNYVEEKLSPIKRTSRKLFSNNNGDDEFKPQSRNRKSNIFYCPDSDKIKSESSTPRSTLTSKTSVARTSTRSTTHKNYVEEDVSPIKKRDKNERLIYDYENECDDDFKPKTPRTPRTSKTTPAKTPKRRILMSQLTPTLHERIHSVENVDEFKKENKSLPGRESQMDEILSFVRTKLLNGSSGCMYISGVPGTGKTATVNCAMKILKDEVDLPDFNLVEVNGMRIAEPRQAYVQMYKQLTGKTVLWEQACSLLEKRFTNPGPRRTPTVLLVDELDALCTRRQDVLYSIMEWAAHNTALLTVLAVANTMDLPERALASRVASRLGLTRLTFPPYTHMQLQKIVATKLVNANVTSDAVQLIARKVAAVSGDARRALALCSRAVELAGPGGAGLNEVQKALGEAASSAAVKAIKSCSPAERLMLRAVAAEVERTGSDETTLSRALSTAAAIVVLDGRPYRSAVSIRAPTPSQAQAICTRLAAMRLLLFELKAAEPKLLLNISPDDVHYATKQFSV